MHRIEVSGSGRRKKEIIYTYSDEELVSTLRRLERADNVERQELLTSLAHTRALIQQAYRGFNSAEDGDLIESYVFEINALQSRYNYLLRRVKELEAQP